MDEQSEKSALRATGSFYRSIRESLETPIPTIRAIEVSASHAVLVLYAPKESISVLAHLLVENGIPR